MNGEYNYPRNTMPGDDNYNNDQYNQINNKYSLNGMCFVLLLIVCSIFISYCCNGSSNGNIYTSDIERPIIILNCEKYDESRHSSQKNCSICLEEYKKNDNINVLKCNHIFHNNCLKMWLLNNNTCPLCRWSLS
jgi:hypothetical protein